MDLDDLKTRLDEDNPHRLELESIITALSYLPPAPRQTPKKCASGCAKKRSPNGWRGGKSSAGGRRRRRNPTDGDSTGGVEQ